ncbi:intramolecular chaperone auto-processing domain protein [Vibrio phage 1.198.B._10N.286.54.F4]|nr:intramolecular chaperone auto-processing domain protein [Vibrio phage 1.198.A._10N.286.54.F4]AUR94831.1 intramolecular chaperone auto-processing domain protein [Vibrio phage 1.198.B._10N.286.54.F4]
MSCEDYPTAQTAKTFKLDAETVNEVVTLEQDRTSEASDGKTKKTLWGIENDATNQRDEFEQLASDQRDSFEASFSSQFNFKRIGNISDYAGQSLPEADKLNSYQFPDDSGDWYAPEQGQSFPIIIPADPTVSGSGWSLVNGLTKSEADGTYLAINDISDYTYRVYESVGDMLSSSTEVGYKYSTGITIWLRVSGDGSDISHFEPKNKVHASDFGGSQADLELAYASFSYIVISETYTVSDFTLACATEFTDNAKLIVSGSFAWDGQIYAPVREIIDSSAITSWSIGDSIETINPAWFSDGVGPSEGVMVVRGKGSGRTLVGTGNGYCHIDGYRAAELTTSAIGGTVIGPFAGASATSLDLCSIGGYGSLRGKELVPGTGVFESTFGKNVTTWGVGAFQDGTYHENSTAMGALAGRNIPTSVGLTLYGYRCAINAGPIINGLILGQNAALVLNLGLTDTDTTNVCIAGSGAAQDMTRGKRVTSFGDISSRYNQDGDDITNIGYLTGTTPGSPDVSRTINVGSSARSSADDTITVGNNLINSIPGRMYLGDSKTTSVSLQGVYNSTIASSANVYVNEFGQLFRSTSTEKFKEIIEDVSLEWALKTLEFKPILYKPTENALSSDWSYYGYSAEQVYSIDPRYAHLSRDVVGKKVVEGEALLTEEGEKQYDSDGELIKAPDVDVPIYSDDYTPSGVMYERIVVAQQLIIKDLLGRVETLESKLG